MKGRIEDISTFVIRIFICNHISHTLLTFSCLAGFNATKFTSDYSTTTYFYYAITHVQDQRVQISLPLASLIQRDTVAEGLTFHLTVTHPSVCCRTLSKQQHIYFNTFYFRPDSWILTMSYKNKPLLPPLQYEEKTYSDRKRRYCLKPLKLVERLKQQRMRTL